MYVRKSRLKEDDAMEIERQLELLVDYANKNNMEYDADTDVFKEEGSSEDWNRAEFQKMLRALGSGMYDGVLVTEQDRISRDSTDMGLFKRFCINHSLLLFTLSKTYNFFNDEDNFMSGIQGEMDAHFMRITKRKLMRGRIKALNDGVYFGIAPLGYKKPNSKPKKLIIDPEKSKAIELIFDMYVNKRMTQTDIAERLNLLGFKTLYNKPFTARATSLILSNEAYIGTLRYELSNFEPIIVENAHPAIIDKEIFEKAQIILAEKRIVPQDSRKGTYLLSKLIKCAKCGTTLSFSYSFKSTARDRGKELYILNCYASSSAKKRAEIKNNPILRCDNYGSPAEHVEKAVIKELEDYVNDLSERIDELESTGDDLFNEINEKIGLINKRLNSLENERKRVQDGYKAGIYESDEAQQLIKEIKENKLKLEYEKKELEGKDSSSEINKLNTVRDEVIEFLSSDYSDIQKSNAVLRRIISKVVYFKNGRGNHIDRKLPFVSVEFNV